MNPNEAASDVHTALVEERGAEYGESWQLTDQWIKEHAGELGAAPSPFTMILIHNKLMRALTTPTKRDHYDDIIGYAKLALRALDQLQTEIDALPTAHWLTDKERIKMRGFEG